MEYLDCSLSPWRQTVIERIEDSGDGRFAHRSAMGVLRIVARWAVLRIIGRWAFAHRGMMGGFAHREAMGVLRSFALP